MVIATPGIIARMDIIQAILLGVVQGVTEILPISSSGHLVLMPWLFDFEDPGLSFDVALHLGTLLAIVLVFYGDIGRVLKGGVDLLTKKDFSDPYQRLVVFLGVGTVPGVVAGVLLEKYANSVFRSPLLIAATLIFFAGILFYADKTGSKTGNLEGMTVYQGLGIGAAQALAIVPGVSRSGVTISAGLLGGLGREDAARFSFLLSIPIILGAAVFQLKDMPAAGLFSAVFVAGFLSAAISSFVSVRFVLSFVRKHSFNVFVYYRIMLSALIVAVYFLKQ